MTDRAQIAGTWVHANEEDGSGTMVFRSPSHPLPRTRGARFSLDLSPDGTVQIGGPGMADRPTSSTGRWSIVSVEGRECLRVEEPDGRVHEWPIESVAPDRLVLRKSR